MTEFGYNEGYDFFDQSLLPVLRHTPSHSTCRGGEIALALARSARKKVAILGLKVIYQALYRQSSCLPAPLVSRKILTWLTEHRDCQKPFFVFAHYEDVHEPYTPPAQHVRLFAQKGVNGKRLMKKGRRSPELLTPDEVHQLRAVYDAGIHYLDAQLGRLFTRLKELDIYDESLIVITADHGDGFMEHGFVSHPQRLYNELLHVPLIIKFPHGVHSSRRETRLSRALDIVPTILDACGVPLPDDLDGNSLLPYLSGSGDQDSNSSISEGYSDASLDETLTSLAIQDDIWKLIMSGINAGEQTYELYNLRVDPQEQQNVHDRFLEVASKLKERLQEHHSRLSGVARLDDSEKFLLDDIVTERLKALGYLGD